MFQKMWKKVLNCIIGILFILSLIMNGILGYLNYRYRNTPPEKIEIHDTFTIHKDSIHEKIVYKTKFDTIIDVQYIDTIHNDTIRDTILVSLPIEHKVDSFTLKRDSLTITEKIYHNGFRSNIDSIDFSYDFHYTLKKKKKIQLTWSIGPAFGYGFGLNGNTIVGTPYLGIGATIGFGNVIETK